MILIYGCGDLAENLFYLLKQENKPVDGFCVNKAYHKEKEILEQPVYCFEDLEKNFSEECFEFYVCIGYTDMNIHRKEIFDEIHKKGYKIKSYMHNTAQVYATHVGEGCLFFENVYVGMFSNIGSGNVFYTKSMVAHHSSVGNYNFFAISSSVAGKVKIGNFNFIGNNASTKDRITISDYVLVGANSYVAHDLSSESVVVPPKSFVLKGKKSRDFL